MRLVAPLAKTENQPAAGSFLEDKRDPVSGAVVDGAFVSFLPPGIYRILVGWGHARAFYSDHDWREKHLSGASKIKRARPARPRLR